MTLLFRKSAYHLRALLQTAFLAAVILGHLRAEFEVHECTMRQELSMMSSEAGFML